MKEASDFMRIVLEMHEKLVSTTFDRPYRDIDQTQIEHAVKDLDKNKDNKITKAEIRDWVVRYMQSNNAITSKHHSMMRKVTIRGGKFREV